MAGTARENGHHRLAPQVALQAAALLVLAAVAAALVGHQGLVTHLLVDRVAAEFAKSKGSQLLSVT